MERQQTGRASLPAEAFHQGRSGAGLRAEEANIVFIQQAAHRPVAIRRQVQYPIQRKGRLVF